MSISWSRMIPPTGARATYARSNNTDTNHSKSDTLAYRSIEQRVNIRLASVVRYDVDVLAGDADGIGGAEFPLFTAKRDCVAVIVELDGSGLTK